MANNKTNNKSGVNIGKMLMQSWSRYSYVFVLLIILIVYAVTINAARK